jgi:ATP-dependent Clp protease ATP-binding subunit ClpC
VKFRIPIVVVQTPGTDPVYHARPLFHEEPFIKGRLLERVLAKLGNAVRKTLNSLAREPRLEALANFAFSPPLYEKTYELEFHHKKRTVKGQFLVVVLPDQQPRVAFCPLLPDLWFQLHRGEDLKQRTIDVLDHYFQRGAGTNEEAEHPNHGWITEIELNFRVPPTPPKTEQDPNRAILGGAPVQPGWLELERVGRSLDDQYPHDLNRCLCRDVEAARLTRATVKTARAPQLVVGPPKVGKTSLIHDIVRRYRQGKGSLKRRFWLLSPQRLISGMSFVGQWESRLLAILKHAAMKDLVLVFEDLIGLFSAGVSRDSNLCVADVLKPYLQRGEVRILAECTSEGLAILRERDRGFADLFTITHLYETSDQETLEIALEEIREGERLHNCRFGLDALSSAIDLQRRYVRDSAFPGKVASFLRKVAARHRSGEVARGDVLEYFQTISGMSLGLLDDRHSLKREVVQEALVGQILGQPAAVDAATDAVMMTKARLCDPSRPLASLLFVGPTGVGKTECAKALARYLFGDDQRLLRFDMNEYGSPYAATRLVGTFHQPDGLLTAAVRRRPFCVLLLDEIEKAHHEVFNLLLQVLGDGRLTDARGRTVDFTQTIVILTSNLGVREASKPIGLRSKASEESLTYRRAVESFFAPEFFNRLDRVVPFGRLSRDDTAVLAKRLINKVLSREGLVRRQCILDVDPNAMEQIVEMGYHPQLGARALKRSIEKQISAPVSAQLTEMKPNAPTVISIQGKEDLQVRVRELTPAAPRFSLTPRDFTVDHIQKIEARLEEKSKALQTPAGLIDEEITQEQIWYYSVQDQIRRTKAICRRLRRYLEGSAPNKREFHSSHQLLHSRNWHNLLDSQSLAQGVKELKTQLPTNTEECRLQAKFVELLAEIALLSGSGQEESAVLEIAFNPAAEEWARNLTDRYLHVFSVLEFDVTTTCSEGKFSLAVTGPQAETFVKSEMGLHLFSTDRGLFLVEVVGAEQVVRVYDHEGGIDLRTGWMVPRGFVIGTDFHYLMLTAHPGIAEVFD